VRTITRSLLLFFVCCWLAAPSQAGELVRVVRNKISAGDILSCEAMVEDYKKKTGVDTEYLDAIGWIARGAEMMRLYDKAALYVAELRREITEEKSDRIGALGTAIEVEGKLKALKDKRAAVKFWQDELARAKDIGLRSRINKNINTLSLEGQPAPEISTTDALGTAPASLAALKGKPVLLFLWANWCGDCKSQAGILARIHQKYSPQGLVVVAPTRYYGSDDKKLTPAHEKEQVAKVWKESYAGLEGVPIVFDTEAMVRYGIAATPTFVLIDAKGIVKWYTPTRLSEVELSRHIEPLLQK
jgi:thiol-disulfide isomerase/thioredoxin